MTAAAEAVALPRAVTRTFALPLLFVAATVYHFLQSRGHATLTVFNDELLYTKLSQSLAAGHGLSIRGQHFYFPSPLAPLVQAPVWLLHSMPQAYAAAKLLNAAVMSAAVFPSYWLARRVVQPTYALVTAAAAVATPAMVYHGYLMSEALAYPLFLCAVAVIVRGVERPSLAVPIVCALAIATRAQFLVLPLAYLAAIAVCERGRYRRHLVPVTVTSLLLVLLVGVPGALGQYGEATHIGHDPGAVAHWALTTGSLLPYSLGLAIVPGALFGFGVLWRKPIGVVSIACTALFLGQATLIAAGEAHRPLERYVFYVTPLVFLAFFAYVERGAPWRRAYTLFTIAGAVALSLVSFPGLTGTAGFFFDSFTLTGFARASYYLGLTNASLLYALAPLALGALALAVRRIPLMLATVAIAAALATGVGVYATDRLATAFAARTFNAEPADWLDRSGLGPATYLVLPQSDYFVGTGLESWNRDVRHVAVLQTQPPDPFPSTVARITRDGSLVLGSPTRIVVANVAGSAIGLDGTVVARPRKDLVAYRVPVHPHVRWLADGLAPDRWTGTKLRYQAWPVRAGRYELTLSVPRGEQPRRVWIGRRTFVVTGARHVDVATTGAPLVLQVKVPNAPLGARALGVQVLGLRFVPR
ncbi:MAG TPA: hypothetical protein VLB89_05260 [Gaiellaceae bacterium]|nr:hypothetical protein [Gaiellaceae bacterium]